MTWTREDFPVEGDRKCENFILFTASSLISNIQQTVHTFYIYIKKQEKLPSTLFRDESFENENSRLIFLPNDEYVLQRNVINVVLVI